MSDDGAEEFPKDFLEQFDLAAIMRMLQSPGPVNWQVATDIAAQLSGVDPQSGERRVEPMTDPGRLRTVEALVQAAQTHVASATGLAAVTGVPVRFVTRVEWANLTLDGLHPVLEALAGRLGTAFGGAVEDTNPMMTGAGAEDMMTGLVRALAPMLFGVQAGSLCGLLAQRALGQFDLPLPLGGTPQLAFVLPNVEAFADDWSLPFDDLAFALALRETVHAAQRSVPWVRDRLVRLSTQFVEGYTLDPDVLEARLGDAFGDLGSMPFAMGELDEDTVQKMMRGEMPELPEGMEMPAIDPQALLAGMRTDAQAPVLDELQRFCALLGGYADAVVESIAARLVPDAGRIEEALRRHRVEQGAAADFVESMLGLDISREQYERAHGFCAGVVEREGLDGLNRLWEREAMVPTPNELDAPGLWLARLDLDLD